MMGLLEFALAFQATLGINRASQQAALLASEAGNTNGADCLILQQVEADIGPVVVDAFPARRTRDHREHDDPEPVDEARGQK